MMEHKVQESPRIEELKWGAVRVTGYPQSFKDVKLYPGGAREWNWGETGTSHSAGIQPADVEELVQHGAEVVILSRGQLQRLRVSPETIQCLEEQGVEVHVLVTPQAVEMYNNLADRTPVGALIHSTC